MTYHPLQRAIEVRILAPIGFLQGSMRVPERALLVDHFSHAPAFATLYDVTIEASGASLKHFSLHHDAIHLLLPSEKETLVENASGETRPRRILVTTELCSLEGTVHLLPGTRVSDTFAHRRGFFVMTHATLLATHTRSSESGIPRVIVNADRMIGVADLEEDASL